MIEHLYEDLSVHLYEGEPITKKAPIPPPITYLTQWKIVGNSEVHDNEIWSCGEYNPTDGKYHILVQPLGGSVADIALDEPLRKVNDVADSIEFPSGTEGKALVTRNLGSVDLGTLTPYPDMTAQEKKRRWKLTGITNIKGTPNINTKGNILCNKYTSATQYQLYINTNMSCAPASNGINIYDEQLATLTYIEVRNACNGVEAIYEFITPTTELIDAPQIEEAESYSMVISQGGKAVSWSSFITNNE